MKILIALGYASCWGVGLTLTKVALSGIPATTLLVIQLVASVTFLASLCWLRDRHLPLSWRHLKQGRAGVFEPALAYMVGIFGVDLTTASNATLIGSSEVILTIVLAALLLGESLTRTKLFLAGTSTLGLVLLMLHSSETGDQASHLGDFLVLLGTVFAVFYVLLSKRQLTQTPPLQLTTAQQTVGLGVTLVCFGGLSLIHPSYAIHFGGIAPQFWLLAIVSGILQYALAFFLYLTALRHIPASHAAFYVALIPIFGVVSAMLIIGEQPTVFQWVGGGLVILSSSWVHNLNPSA